MLLASYAVSIESSCVYCHDIVHTCSEWIMLLLVQVQAKYGDFNKDTHKPGFLAKERLLPQRYTYNLYSIMVV